jgi:hypothetical protein
VWIFKVEKMLTLAVDFCCVGFTNIIGVFVGVRG